MERSASGFTLIEIIIALVLAGLLASLAGPLLSGAIKESSKSLQGLNTTVTLQSIMEQVVQYRQANSTLSLDTINTQAQKLVSTGYSVSSAKTGFCTVSSSKFVVDASATSSGFYMLTLVNDGTKESITMIFTKK